MVWHPLAALAHVPGLSEVIIIGFYEDSMMSGFVKDSKKEFPNIAIRCARPRYHSLTSATCENIGLWELLEACITVSEAC